MVEYYKGSKNFQFRLKDLKVDEEFSIWASWDKKGQDVRDGEGNILQFPLTTGLLKDREGKPHDVQDLKYMKGIEFRDLFPDLQKSTRYIRQVIIGGEEFFVRFSPSVNKKLLSLLDNLQALQINPLNAVFEQAFDGSKRPSEMYSLQLIKKDETEEENPPDGNTLTVTRGKVVLPGIITGINDQPASEPVKGLPASKPLADREREILDAIRGAFGTGADEERFVGVYEQNGIAAERGKEIFHDFYRK